MRIKLPARKAQRPGSPASSDSDEGSSLSITGGGASAAGATAASRRLEPPQQQAPPVGTQRPKPTSGKGGPRGPQGGAGGAGAPRAGASRLPQQRPSSAQQRVAVANVRQLFSEALAAALESDLGEARGGVGWGCGAWGSSPLVVVRCVGQACVAAG